MGLLFGRRQTRLFPFFFFFFSFSFFLFFFFFFSFFLFFFFLFFLFFLFSLFNKQKFNKGFGLDEQTRSSLYKKYQYIQDNDLWKHLLPKSKEFTYGFQGLKLEFDCNKNPSIFESLINFDLEESLEKGAEKMEATQKIITQEIEKSFTIKLGDGKNTYVGLAVLTDLQELRSELGNQLCIKSEKVGNQAFGAICYYTETDQIKVSLRSLSHFDTTPISSYYGGGGHKSASSFVVSRSVFESMKQ